MEDTIADLWPMLLIGIVAVVFLIMNIDEGVQKREERQAELEERRAQRRDAQERRAAEQADDDPVAFKGDQDQDVPPPSEGASTPTQAMDAEEEARLASLDAMADEEAMKEEADEEVGMV